MRRFIFLLPLFLASFQLTFAHALLAALGPDDAQQTVTYHGQQTVSEKHNSLFNLLLQLLNPEEIEEEKETKPWAELPFVAHDHYSFGPVFSVQNKHFLIHYAAAIKGKLPDLFLLHDSFLI